MGDPKNIFDLEYVTPSNVESINPTWIEEETSTTVQGFSGTQNGILNPNSETPTKT
jgi:hypothetical protein